MNPLGEFELLILLAVMRLENDAYAVSVREAIESRTGRTVARGAVYMTLDRLIAKGLVRERTGAATTDRGGRAKRLFSVTRAGEQATRDAWEGLRRMQQGIPLLRNER